MNGGGWNALDPAMGEILWLTANPTYFPAMGAGSTAQYHSLCGWVV